jgi:periplasmic copper chaperone A
MKLIKYLGFGSAALSVSLSAVLSFFSPPTFAQKTTTSPVTITDAWVKTTVPGGAVSAAYMQITSAVSAKLVKVEVPISGNVEIHDMKMSDGVMEMKALDALDLPANQAVTLKPGGLHVMLMKLKQPINKGDNVPLKLTFEGADKKTFTMDVMAKAQERAEAAHKQ